jgi:hypothetical protein
MSRTTSATPTCTEKTEKPLDSHDFFFNWGFLQQPNHGRVDNFGVSSLINSVMHSQHIE